jgi:hypothetical protein
MKNLALILIALGCLSALMTSGCLSGPVKTKVTYNINITNNSDETIDSVLVEVRADSESIFKKIYSGSEITNGKLKVVFNAYENADVIFQYYIFVGDKVVANDTHVFSPNDLGSIRSQTIDVAESLARYESSSSSSDLSSSSGLAESSSSTTVLESSSSTDPALSSSSGI